MSVCIHRFRVNGCEYAYDAGSNAIIGLDALCSMLIRYYGLPTEEILRRVNNAQPPESISSCLEELRDLESSGRFFGEFTPILRSPSQAEIRNLSLTSVLIYLTLACNMACRYCYQEREQISMNRRIAKKLVDFLARYANKKTCHVRFYGGEPFLKFELMQSVVHSLNQVANDANFVYSVTTNGTLLDVERIRFLVQNRFGITISLDGPKEIHDQNRVFGGGKGSFDIVLRNLLLIRHENKDYFEKYVSIHAAVSPFHKRRMEILMDYFSGLGVEKIDLQRTVGTADACRGSCVGRSRSSPSIEREGGVTDFLVERFRKKEYNKIPMFQRLRYIDYLRSPDMPCAIPACGAGFRKMAVSPEGRLLLCYQFLDTELTIGNIDTGVDHDMVYAIYSKVQQPPGGCHSCWAIRFCGSGCLRLIYNARDFVISTPFCIATREIATRILRLYVRIARDTPESYEEYLKYIHSRKPSDFLEKTVYD